MSHSPLLILAALSILALMPSSFATDDILAPPTPHNAHATLQGKNNSNVTGDVDFTEVKATGIMVHYKLSGLAPNEHLDFQIHDKSNCSAKNSKPVNDHYKDIQESKGITDIVTDALGNAEGSFPVEGLSMNKTNPIADKTVIIRGNSDELATQSSPRIACGVIKRIRE